MEQVVKLLKKSRVLDWTYKQTDITSVYTKITFFYHWDYALGKYTKSVTLPLIDNLDNVGEADGYLYSYYGFDNRSCVSKQKQIWRSRVIA